jgi:hypothetical protein
MSNCIVSVGVGAWHPQGIDRLEQSLKDVGWQGGVLTFRSVYPPASPTHQEVNYGFKIYAIEEAVSQGYRNVLWVDSSVWAVKNPEPIFSIIQNQGYYLWDSGYRCSEWINDKTLNAFGITRAEAHDIAMISANIMGFDVQTEVSKTFLAHWRSAMANGLFNGPWTRQEGDQEEPPYRGHRHDQSSASLIAKKMGLSLEQWGRNCQYDEDDKSRISPTICLTLRGM